VVPCCLQKRSIVEEVGEVGKELAEGDLTGTFDRDKYIEECLHTAAVALAMVQCIQDGEA